MKNPGHKESQTEIPESSPESLERKRHPIHWAFPLGIGIAGLASAAAVIFRGCWHRNMSWPIRVEDEHGHFSYQVCNDCGIMRLFDERTFRGHGPYGYDLHALIAGERLQRLQRMRKAEQKSKPAGAPESAPGYTGEANRQAGSD